MMDEPYRWLEAVANRREYVRDQLKGGTPVLAASVQEGIILLGVGSGHSKLFEIFDRHAMAGLGHPADLEKLRQAAIDACHLEAFTRAPEDVSLRRLISFGIGPMLKTSFEQIFSPPYLVELIFAELGDDTSSDMLVRLRYDGGFSFSEKGVAIACADHEVEGPAIDWARGLLDAKDNLAGKFDALLQVWWCASEGKAFEAGLPDEAARQAGWKQALKGKTLEAGLLARRSRLAARFQPLTLAELGL